MSLDQIIDKPRELSMEEKKERLRSLSDKQLMVFRLFCNRYTQAEMAALLGGKIPTYKTHMARIKDKLIPEGVKDEDEKKSILKGYCPVLMKLVQEGEFGHLLDRIEKLLDNVEQFTTEAEQGNENLEISSNTVLTPPVQSNVEHDLENGSKTSEFNFSKSTPDTVHSRARPYIRMLIRVLVLIVLILSGIYAKSSHISRSQNPSVTATPGASSNILFMDDFHTGLLSQWQIVSGQPNALHGILTADEESWLTAGNPYWTDYEVDLEMRVLPCSETVSPTVIGVRSMDINHMIAWKVSGCASGWYLVQNGQWNNIPITNLKLKPDWYIIHIIVHGDQIDVNDDEQKLASFSTDQFPNGQIALRLDRDSRINSIQIQSLQQ